MSENAVHGGIWIGGTYGMASIPNDLRESSISPAAYLSRDRSCWASTITPTTGHGRHPIPVKPEASIDSPNAPTRSLPKFNASSIVGRSSWLKTNTSTGIPEYLDSLSRISLRCSSASCRGPRREYIRAVSSRSFSIMRPDRALTRKRLPSSTAKPASRTMVETFSTFSFRCSESLDPKKFVNSPNPSPAAPRMTTNSDIYSTHSHNSKDDQKPSSAVSGDGSNGKVMRVTLRSLCLTPAVIQPSLLLKPAASLHLTEETQDNGRLRTKRELACKVAVSPIRQ